MTTAADLGLTGWGPWTDPAMRPPCDECGQPNAHIRQDGRPLCDQCTAHLWPAG